MLEVLVNMLKELGEDVSYSMIDGKLSVTVIDFDGFDEDWSEIERDYDEEAVEGFVEWLETHAHSVEEGYYSYYHLGDVVVCVGYASYDI